MAQNRGSFAWVELMTTDVPSAIEFYTQVMGWTTAPWGDDYTMFNKGDLPVGGVLKMPEKAAQMGAPPYWLAYITTPDVDATVKQATELGGRVLNDAMDIPQIGRFAVVQDPQGGVFAPFKPEGSNPATRGKAPGYAWHEHGANDYNAAFDFYSKLFGWQKRQEMDMGPGGMYMMFGDVNSDIGGMYTMPSEMPAPPHWLHYADVDDCDKAVDRIKAAGGFIVNGPMDVPGGGRIAVAGDRQQAMFAVHSFKK